MVFSLFQVFLVRTPNKPKESLPPKPSYDYLEQRGTVEAQINPRERGRVKYRNTTWFAICPEDITLSPGQPCQVVDIHAATLTLIVKPVNLD